MAVSENKTLLVDAVSRIAGIKAIGQTGDISEIPQPGKGDIDLFVFCSAIPSEAERRTAYETCKDAFGECRMTVCEGGHWGTEDALTVDGVDTFLMYFTVEGTRSYIADALDGKYPDKVGEFYPLEGWLPSVRSMCCMTRRIHWRR
jgi:hypothetical protein